MDTGADGDTSTGADGDKGTGAGEAAAEEPKTKKNKDLAAKFVEKMDRLRASRQKASKKKVATTSTKKKVVSKRTTAKRKGAQTRKAAATAATTGAAKRSRGNQSDDDVHQTPSKKSKSRTAVVSPASRWKDRRIPDGGTIKVGSKVMGKWCGNQFKGDWYEGVVKSINTVKKTVHVVYTDGDHDKELEWSNLRIIDG